MLRLNLTIADDDNEYIENIAEFLINKYSQKFQINFFTHWEYLSQFLSKKEEEPDIILISPKLYSKLKEESLKVNPKDINSLSSNLCNDKNLNLEEKPIFILLSKTKMVSISEHPTPDINIDRVYKYQHGDRFVRDIIHIYSKYRRSLEPSVKQLSKTVIISVYSPVGGSGKTTLATDICANCARNGMEVLYLNLEYISSTFSFFEPDREVGSCENFSNIIYTIKEKDCNLFEKIEGVKFTDALYNVHYLPPPDSALEIEELLPDEIRVLLNCLKARNSYKVIVIDLSSTFNLKNITVMEESDEIILVYTPDKISKFKMAGFIKETHLYQKRKNINLLNKATFVINKYDKDAHGEDNLFEFKDNVEETGFPIDTKGHFKIPCCKGLSWNHNTPYPDKAEGLKSFNSGVLELIKKHI